MNHPAQVEYYENLKEYPIGYKFIRTARKNTYVETITDILKTYSTKTGQHVTTRYVATHEFMGQTVTDFDIRHVSIQRATPV